MYELVQVSEKCYYINCPANIKKLVLGLFVVKYRHWLL